MSHYIILFTSNLIKETATLCPMENRVGGEHTSTRNMTSHFM